MSDAEEGRARADLATRAFAWYWRRRARRARDPGAFLRLVDGRRAELDAIAAKVEARLAASRRPDDGAETAGWRLTPECLTQRLAESAVSAPKSGLRFGRLLTLHHDDKAGAFLVSQRPARDPDARRRFGLHFESYEFSGAYFSLSLGAPDEIRRPRQNEKLVFSLHLVAPAPMRGYIRLNLHGPQGEETLYADAMLGDGDARFVFDLAFARFEMGDTDAFWIDLIFDRPRMTEFTISEMSMSLEGAA